MRQRQSARSDRRIQELADKVERDNRYRSVDDLAWHSVFSKVRKSLSTEEFQKISDTTKEVFAELRSREASENAKEDHERYLKTERWEKRRKEKLEQENYECEDCGGRATEAHHLSYRNLDAGDPEAEIRDLVALCEACHKRRHGEITTPVEETQYDQDEVENILSFNRQEIQSYKELKNETNDPKRLRWLNKEIDRLKEENQKLEGEN